MASYKTKKNLLGSRDVYSVHYDNFRGVDFSSDHTQVHEQRLAYLVNMFKDYQSGQGQAIETVPGFRRRVELPLDKPVHGIHYFSHKDASGHTVSKVLLHAGTSLYLWENYPNSVGVVKQMTVKLPLESSVTNGTKTFVLSLEGNVYTVTDVFKTNGESIRLNSDYNASTHTLDVLRSDLSEGDYVVVAYTEGTIEREDALFSSMNEQKSVSFLFHNRLYLIDGKNYLVYDGSTLKSVLEEAYVPTTFVNIIPSGENADNGTETEQRNLLSPYFKHTFVADGATVEFCLNEEALDGISEVRVYEETKVAGTDYTVDAAAGKIRFTVAPTKPEDAGYPQGYAGVEITAKKAFTSVSEVAENVSDISTLITHCTVAAIYDNRVFLSGNPDYPNHLFYSMLNNPAYFGAMSHQQDGVGIAPITGMIPVADSLMVLKGDTQQDGSVYFHTPTETGDELTPKTYPSTRGLSGIGCLGACINFLDDPVFVSRLGVEAVGQLSVRYERAIEHRSSLIDAKLVNLNLAGAVLEEWNGYLLLLVDGKIFMADSRQRYTHEIGVTQYEWYYLEDIGVWEGQYTEYTYATDLPSEFAEAEVHFKDDADNEHSCRLMLANAVFDSATHETKNLLGTVVNPPDTDGTDTKEVFSEVVTFTVGEITYRARVYFTVHEVRDALTDEFLRYEAYLCDTKEQQTGGVFKPAVTLRVIDGNIFFGTENGIVCSFNFDQRDELGEIPTECYQFDGRTIFCGCATKMDCCGIPHLTKTTVKKSTVIKTKTLTTSAAKVKVRTNRKPYEQIARINSTVFSFDSMDFSDFTFELTEQSLFSIKEKEKKWVEKQYFLYSDEYQRPFALFYISYRYMIAGRFKE